MNKPSKITNPYLINDAAAYAQGYNKAIDDMKILTQEELRENTERFDDQHAEKVDTPRDLADLSPEELNASLDRLTAQAKRLNEIGEAVEDLWDLFNKPLDI